MKDKEPSTYQDYMKLLMKEMDSFVYKRNIWDVWQDWLSLMAISISNSVEFHSYQSREEDYLKIVKKYDKSEIEHFVTMFTYLIAGLQACGPGAYKDMLGDLYHRLNLHNKNNGEFFTPIHISDFMAEIQMIDCEERLNKEGYLSVCEPTCGSGVMVIAFANALMRRGYDVSKRMVAICTDINITCVKMCYVQLSLIGVPAVVIHGNSLTVETWQRWYTPMYVWRNWLWYFTDGKIPRL